MCSNASRSSFKSCNPGPSVDFAVPGRAVKRPARFPASLDVHAPARAANPSLSSARRSIMKKLLQALCRFLGTPLLGHLATALAQALTQLGVAQELDEFLAQLNGVFFGCEERVVVRV